MAFPDRLRTNFELVRELPSNKPFDVFLVKDKTKDFRSCVLRVLPASLSGKKTAVEAFMGYFSKFSEIINRAYIPSVYSVSGQVGGNVYVLEEHVSGIDLTTFIKSKRNTPEFNREIISIAGKVCEALHHAHQKDLFHLGITPEDILIDTSTGRVKLVGFGVQIFTQLNKMGILSAHACKTIAPEILTGDPLRPRTDVYSLAKVMNDVCPEVFFGSDVLSMALLENPEDRYQQARDFEGALNNVLEDINKAARSRNIDTVADSKGGLKPVLTEKPVTAERDVYQPPPRKPNTPQSPPQIKPDTAPPKSISVKLVGAIAVGSIVAIVVLILNVYQGKQRETNQIKEAARVAAIEKEQREKELELPAFAWNYPEDVKNLMKRAFKGDASAQFGMALKYSKGQGIPKDELEAVKWYRKSADQGYASAQYNLGLSYKKGEGVPKDFSEAVKWYRKAAIQENVWARNNLGSRMKIPVGVLSILAFTIPRI